MRACVYVCVYVQHASLVECTFEQTVEVEIEDLKADSRQCETVNNRAIDEAIGAIGTIGTGTRLKGSGFFFDDDIRPAVPAWFLNASSDSFHHHHTHNSFLLLPSHPSALSGLASFACHGFAYLATSAKWESMATTHSPSHTRRSR